jgi:hypothetical protein
MIALTPAKKRRTRDVTGWISLAASPGFGLMAWVAATDVPRIAFLAEARVRRSTSQN